MVLPIGSIANIVDMETKTNLVTVSEDYTLRTSSSFFLTNLPKSETWGFWVLPGSPDPETASRIMVERINEMLLSMLSEFDFVFVDLGRALSRISLPIIRRADAIALIVSTDLSAVTLTRTVLDYLKVQGIEMENVYTILNRPVGVEGMLKPDVEAKLGVPVHLTIPYVAGNFTLANSNHVPLSLRFPSDSAVLAVQQAAEEIHRAIQKE
jgi:pilus assembly protein CpaE